ncbi:DUF4272 domain-containing protein [Variovorax sp. NFACC27]|uniref:DUF4272 domain-containing protein n=1 Tax=unclassified Variovorax TaxID=663243 RepID=UPI000B89C2A7
MAALSNQIGGDEDDVVRPLQDVLNRTLVLGAVVASAFGAPCEELMDWLAAMSLSDELTPNERAQMTGAASEQMAINFSWQSERLVVLLWALHKIPALPFPTPGGKVAFIERLLPPYGDESASEFCETARLRSDGELFAAAYELQDLHVVARQRGFSHPDYRPKIPELDAEVVQERHHAINWLVGYCGQSWDQVTTDT